MNNKNKSTKKSLSLKQRIDLKYLKEFQTLSSDTNCYEGEVYEKNKFKKLKILDAINRKILKKKIKVISKRSAKLNGGSIQYYLKENFILLKKELRQSFILMDNFYKNEGKGYIPSNCLKHQPLINENDRKEIVMFVLENSFYLKLSYQTLFFCVNLIDKYLLKLKVKKEKFKLLAVICLYISIKYEEVEASSIKDYLEAINCTEYSIEQIVEGEKFFLKSLNYDLFYEQPSTFISFFSKSNRSDPKTTILSRLILELTLLIPELINVKGSFIAACSYYLAIKILSGEENFIDYFIKYKCFESEPAFKKMLGCLLEFDIPDFISKKYENSFVGNVSYTLKQFISKLKAKISLDK